MTFAILSHGIGSISGWRFRMCSARSSVTSTSERRYGHRKDRGAWLDSAIGWQCIEVLPEKGALTPPLNPPSPGGRGGRLPANRSCEDNPLSVWERGPRGEGPEPSRKPQNRLFSPAGPSRSPSQPFSTRSGGSADPSKSLSTPAGGFRDPSNSSGTSTEVSGEPSK